MSAMRAASTAKTTTTIARIPARRRRVVAACGRQTGARQVGAWAPRATGGRCACRARDEAAGSTGGLGARGRGRAGGVGTRAHGVPPKSRGRVEMVLHLRPVLHDVGAAAPLR